MDEDKDKKKELKVDISLLDQAQDREQFTFHRDESQWEIWRRFFSNRGMRLRVYLLAIPLILWIIF